MAGSRKRVRLTWMGVLAVLLVLVVLSLGLGTVRLSPTEVLQALLGQGRDSQVYIVRGLRVPRACLALLAGVAFGVAGALIQSVTRNRLADPSLLGISQGASLALVASGIGLTLSPARAVIVGLLGAGTASVLVSYLARGRHGTTLLIQGIVLTAVASAVIQVIISWHGDSLAVVLRWTVGSMSGRSWPHLLAVLPWVLVALLVAALILSRVTLLWAGEELSTALGQEAGRSRTLVNLVVVTLAGAATTVVGPMGFLGLIAPNLARLLTGSHPRRLLPLAGLLGAVVLLGADALAQLATLAQPSNLGRTPVPTGVVVGLLGGPALVVMLLRHGES